MRILLFSAGLLGITGTVLSIVSPESIPLEAKSILLLGLTLMVAYLFGRLISPYKLPKITGYLLAGILIGPDVANLLTQQAVNHLQLIDNVALSLIALTAGGEFRLWKIKKQLSLFINVTLWQIILVFLGITALVVLLKPSIPFLQAQDFATVLGVGFLFGVLAIAKSPATTIAIITETRARGRFTDFILGITILKDIIIVLLFAIVLAFAEPLIHKTASIRFSFVIQVLLEILFSLGAGVLVGFLIYLYIRFVKSDVFLFLFGVIFLMIEISHMLHLEIILIFMMAGFVVQNFSKVGDELISAIEKHSLPIYVIFFAIAGASLKLGIFLENWYFTVIIVSARMITTHLGTWMGGQIVQAPRNIKNYGWMGFVGQAGLTLGLSTIIARDIPDTIGESIKTITVAAIAINQILGPILFRFALHRTGEIPTEIRYNPV